MLALRMRDYRAADRGVGGARFCRERPAIGGHAVPREARKTYDAVLCMYQTRRYPIKT